MLCFVLLALSSFINLNDFYRVMGDSFRVSGQLRTLQKLDREEVAEYHFIVQARDGRGKVRKDRRIFIPFSFHNFCVLSNNYFFINWDCNSFKNFK